MYTQPQPKDILKDEAASLKELEKETEADIATESEDPNERQEKEIARLLKVANKIEVSRENLETEIGKKLAADARAYWDEDFVNQDTAEVVPVRSSVIVFEAFTEINEKTIKELIDRKVQEVWVYKNHTITDSVITELPAGKEKEKYDLDRLEIQQIQNIIKLADKLEAIVSKLDVSEGSKKDVTDIVKWMQNDAAEVREWIHKNKKQNKIR